MLRLAISVETIETKIEACENTPETVASENGLIETINIEALP